ncbi:hypothetical protein CC85DRAFT_282882 [Cutaneotrichosporon oleaginosum]|uniref:Uncharacterized protein n=1 Tax=Cutaneotrichosporon oleaginosum TaxID=879819 RepID=A0A0J1BAM9_9TREE|nr:uncharacterized protein CC85DRAFT_282882 [Cutaneotrichosporon oleaginosum]KLT44964.1 hypothetical protein CC85DRAFT_282882 [Cutaneotrichosporon oleaginosum]TXT09653.1 hypothetical protein COLE_03587 [Cutaneotrichosporon oleaginosum]
MRFALILSCAALARAQYSANEGAIASAATSLPATPTPQAAPSPTVSAAVIFPSADSSWSHNGTAYFKYSLPDGVSPKSIVYVLSNDNSALLKAGNSDLDELKSYFVFQRLIRSTAQPAGTGTYWIKWIPAYGDNPDDVQPGSGFKVGVAYRLGDTTQPLQFAWSVPFEIRADGADSLPADVSAYPANATMSNWNPPNGPTQSAVLSGGGLSLAPLRWGASVGAIVAMAVGL